VQSRSPAIEGDRAFKAFAVIALALITIGAFLPFLLIVVASFTDEKTLVEKGYRFMTDRISLGAYAFMNLGAFGILVLIRNRRAFGYTLDEVAGLGRSMPWTARPSLTSRRV